MDDSTVAQLIERAISWENTARDLYLTLSSAFPSYPAVQDIWKQMAIDESTHAAILRKVMDSLPESRLSQRLGAEEVGLIAAVEKELARAAAADLRTLDDAYELAHRLESSEVNTVFQLLVSFQADDLAATSLVDAQFDDHLDRLAHLAGRYDRATRRSIVLQA